MYVLAAELLAAWPNPSPEVPAKKVVIPSAVASSLSDIYFKTSIHHIISSCIRPAKGDAKCRQEKYACSDGAKSLLFCESRICETVPSVELCRVSKDGLDLTGQISKVHFLTLFLRAGLVGWPCLELLHSAGCGISGAVSLS